VAAAFPECIIIAYMDDVHILGPPGRAQEAFVLLSRELEQRGLIVEPGKSQAYSPDAMDQVEAVFPRAMWRPRGLETIDATTLGLYAEGHMVLGTPVGTDDFVGQVVTDTLALVETCIERAFSHFISLDLLPDPDHQCYYQLLRCCVHPKICHLIRSLPPRLVTPFAARFDAAVVGGLDRLVSGSLHAPGREWCVRLAQLPIRLGGVGLTSMTLLSPAGWLGSLAATWSRVSAIGDFDCLELGGHRPSIRLQFVQDTATAVLTLRSAHSRATALAQARPSRVTSEHLVPPSWEDCLGDLAFADAAQHIQRLFAPVMHRCSWEDCWEGGSGLQRLRFELGVLAGTSGLKQRYSPGHTDIQPYSLFYLTRPTG
jgi:hypothetical protein